MRRAALLLAVCLAALAPGTAAAAPILDEADAAELAQALAEATEEQDVCYGWEVQVDDQGGGLSGIEGGSSQGPGRLLDPASCARYAVLLGRVTYTSEMSESEDSAQIGIDSNLSRPPTVDDLAGLELDASDLLSETDDISLIDMVGALPLLVAEHGEGPFIAFEPRTEPLAPGDGPTGTPGSDWLRTFWWLLALGALGVLALLMALSALLRRRGASV